MKAVNRPMRRVLHLPFPTRLSRRSMLVTHVGRRTGRTYQQPIFAAVVVTLDIEGVGDGWPA
jgi:hypothetical protein